MSLVEIRSLFSRYHGQLGCRCTREECWRILITEARPYRIHLERRKPSILKARPFRMHLKILFIKRRVMAEMVDAQLLTE